MPIILYTFFEDYYLSNKTIAPFCTSGGSGLSDTEKTIQALEPSSTVAKGLHASDDVKEWLNEIK